MKSKVPLLEFVCWVWIRSKQRVLGTAMQAVTFYRKLTGRVKGVTPAVEILLSAFHIRYFGFVLVLTFQEH